MAVAEVVSGAADRRLSTMVRFFGMREPGRRNASEPRALRKARSLTTLAGDGDEREGLPVDNNSTKQVQRYGLGHGQNAREIQSLPKEAEEKVTSSVCKFNLVFKVDIAASMVPGRLSETYFLNEGRRSRCLRWFPGSLLHELLIYTHDAAVPTRWYSS